MSIKSALIARNAKIDELVNQFNSLYEGIAPGVKREVQALFRKGVFNQDVIKNVFTDAGFDDLYGGFVDKFDDIIKQGNAVGKAMGIGFPLTEKNYNILDALASQVETRFAVSQASFISSMTDSAMMHRIGGGKFTDIVADMSKAFEGSGRRFAAEAQTGINQFNNAVNYQMFDEAGVERWIYFGPLDEKTRDSCTATKTDPNQETGWTAEQVESSQTPFIEAGGYNCRHEWLAYVGELKEPEVIKIRGGEQV